VTNLFLLVLIAGAVVIAGYFGFRFLKNLIARPILEIHLSPIDEPKWTDRNKITDLIHSLQQKGFESADDYKCLEMPSLIISGFVHASEQMAGVVYDDPVRGIWVDIFVHYNDGGSLTVSNATAGHELDHMPQQAKSYCKGSSVDELLQKVIAERKEGRRITIAKEEFTSRYEAQYQKEMRWRIDRGGPTHLDVRRVAEEMGVSTDRERLERTTQQLMENWEREKRSQQRSETKSETTPRLPVCPVSSRDRASSAGGWRREADLPQGWASRRCRCTWFSFQQWPTGATTAGNTTRPISLFR
jgi:hypothetical protein